VLACGWKVAEGASLLRPTAGVWGSKRLAPGSTKVFWFFFQENCFLAYFMLPDGR
jgi:hypothetical protein